MAWFDVDEDYYSGLLPADVSSARARVRSDDVDAIGLRICRSIEDAELLLAWSNRRDPRNEVIAIHANELDEVKGLIEVPRPALDWIGVDVVVAGLGSLLIVAFYCPDVFPGWAERFGSPGLAASRFQAEDFTAEYQRLADVGTVEPIDESLGPPFVVDVARMPASAQAGVDSD